MHDDQSSSNAHNQSRSIYSRLMDSVKKSKDKELIFKSAKLLKTEKKNERESSPFVT